MRGKLRGSLYRFLYSGITPAHAGKTAGQPVQVFVQWDHPRACGENLSWVAIQIFSVGITPAHAGKT